LLTTNEYLAGFKTRVTNPRGLQTTTSFYAWDTPTQDFPLKLVHPESAVPTILRDVYGKPKEITRYHVNTALGWQRRYFQYNANQELCSRTEVETGTTAMGYDAAGNLAWSAGGQSWSPTGPCASAYDAAVAARRADRTYDQRNRVRTLAFVDGRGDTTYGYTLDGQLEAVTVDNGNGEVATTTYAYNKRRLLTSETLQTGADSWSLGYQYSGYGHVSSQTCGLRTGSAGTCDDRRQLRVECALPPEQRSRGVHVRQRRNAPDVAERAWLAGSQPRRIWLGGAGR
jgi:hypothetical protein